MVNTKSEEIGQKPTNTVTNFKSIIEQLDATAPKVQEVDWSIMERVMGECDFTKCNNTMAAFNLFYQQLWAHVVFPLEEENHLKGREIGRLILEADTHRRQAEKAQEEAESLRKRLQEKGNKEA